MFLVKNKSGKRDSNSRPQPWQGCALPLSYSRNQNEVRILSDCFSFVKDYGSFISEISLFCKISP